MSLFTCTVHTNTTNTHSQPTFTFICSLENYIWPHPCMYEGSAFACVCMISIAFCSNNIFFYFAFTHTYTFTYTYTSTAVPRAYNYEQIAHVYGCLHSQAHATISYSISLSLFVVSCQPPPCMRTLLPSFTRSLTSQFHVCYSTATMLAANAHDLQPSNNGCMCVWHVVYLLSRHGYQWLYVLVERSYSDATTMMITGCVHLSCGWWRRIAL